MAWGLSHALFVPPRKQPAASAEQALFQQIQRVYLPLSYTGRDAVCRFEPGDRVQPGDPLALPENDDPAPVKSCAVIRPAIMPTPRAESDKRISPTPAQVMAAAKAAGIIDELDGLPLHQKLEQWKHEGCHFLVANAVEAEPYASSAWSLLLHQSEQVNSGLWLAAQTIGAAGSHIAVQASRKARQELPPSLDGRLFFVKSGYPVTALTHAGHDIRVGVIGVQACLALQRAVTLHEHHHYATITVTGDAIEHPQNVRAPFGTPVGELLRFCGIKTGVSQIVMGDALTGVAIDSAVLPVLPGVTCLLALSSVATERGPCIGCGQCLSVCHAHLMPGEIARQMNVSRQNVHDLIARSSEKLRACEAALAALVGEAADAGGRLLMEWGNPDGT